PLPEEVSHERAASFVAAIQHGRVSGRGLYYSAIDPRSSQNRAPGACGERPKRDGVLPLVQWPTGSRVGNHRRDAGIRGNPADAELRGELDGDLQEHAGDDLHWVGYEVHAD